MTRDQHLSWATQRALTYLDGNVATLRVPA